MRVTRRDLLVWSAGAAAGLLVTPVPWKLLDDTSIWTQNWPWIPQPARVPVEVKQSCCTLCPNGCGMRVRMAAGWPVGVAGASSHPVTLGALCPLAFGAHQLNWHPARLKAVRHNGAASTWDAARTAFAKACKEGPIVVIDAYPGRASSKVLEQFAQQRGEYRVVWGAQTRALMPYERWSGVPAGTLGYDFENAHTILSFGIPLLDGWGPPGRFTRLWAERAADSTDPQLRLIQAESSLTRTSAKAWKWVQVRDGGESALAAAIARVIIEERLVASRGPMPDISLPEAAAQTGLSESDIHDIARVLVIKPPALAVANDDNPAVAALNVVLSAVGAKGGIVRRSKSGERHVSAEETIPSARAVVLDASVPWDFAPQTDAEIFRFAVWNGQSDRSEWLLPSPGFLEDETDVPTAPTSAIETYAIAAVLTKPPAQVQSAAQFLSSLEPSLMSPEKIVQQRCEEIFRTHHGTLVSQDPTTLEKIESAQKLEQLLRAGAVWVNEPETRELLHCELKEWPALFAQTSGNPSSVHHGWSQGWAVTPPLASKLYKESNLREAPERSL